MGLPEDLKGFGSEAAALGALNAELIGSVFVAAEGAAAGLGKLTEEFPNVLPPNPEDPVEPVGADGLETLEEGVAEGLNTKVDDKLRSLKNSNPNPVGRQKPIKEKKQAINVDNPFLA